MFQELYSSLRTGGLLVLFTVAFATILVIAGCGVSASKSGGTTQEVKLLFWHTLGAAEAEALSPMLQEFAAKNPGIKVVVEAIPFENARVKFEQAVKAGLAPDIFRSDRYWISKFADAGYLEQLDEAISQNDIADLLPITRSSVTFHGKIWGLPHTVDCLALLYNKAHFKEKDVTPPDDFDSFTQVARKLTAPEKGRYGFFMSPDGWWFEPFLYGFGGRYFDASGTLAFRSEQTLKATHFLVDLKENLKVIPPVNFRSGAYKMMMQSFKGGQVSMIFNGTWAIRDIITGSAFKDDSGNLGVALIPRGPVGRFSPIGCQSLVIPKGGHHFKEAVRFISFMCSSEMESAFVKHNFDIPTRKSLLKDPEIQNDPFLKPFIEQIQNAEITENSPESYRLYAPLEDFLQKVLNGDVIPEDAIKDFENAWKNKP
ncbi:MAG: extracellular solute-binding protein [Candidatus Riflebacteria bacterium]|nr:extracellular solute-binding protein [Candidatus Riflebacteria bacterium]